MFPASGRHSKAPLLRNAALCLAVCVMVGSCGGGGGSGDPPPSPSSFPQPPAGSAFLNSNDVDMLVRAAAGAANSDTMAIAVVDRLGNILAVWKGPNMPAMSPSNYGDMQKTDELAVSLARTAAFFSNDQAPLSSRTVRFISGIHFPPGIFNTANADLYGIESTNRGCILSTNFLPGQGIPPPVMVDGTPSHLGIITGKATLMDDAPMDLNAVGHVNPGGVPIFKDDPVLLASSPSVVSPHLVGGIGIAGLPLDAAEFVAFRAAALAALGGPTSAASDGIGFHLPLPNPGVVIIGGIGLPFVDNTSAPADLPPVSAGFIFDPGQYEVSPAKDGTVPPDGWLVGPNPGSALTAAQVMSIVNNAVAQANQTRGVIRLPIGSRARMMIAVADTDGTIIGLFRMHDATIFSIDVAATKSRNVIYFSGATRTAADLPGVPMGTAVTNRTISFGAQPYYPPGIEGTSPGPFFNLFLQDVANPCTEGAHVFSAGQPHFNQSGIVFFPGAVPLFVNGQMVGGLGVSGDGVDQDDFVTSGGMVGFEAPANIRADQVFDEGVRLPYLKFPRNPTD
jgi:uncharacterized protein GlcG (DUF336 family)